MHYKICNPNHGIKNNDIDLKTQIYQMNRSELNIISYEMYDRKGCALCGMKNVFFPNFLTRIRKGLDLEGGEIWRQLSRYGTRDNFWWFLWHSYFVKIINNQHYTHYCCYLSFLLSSDVMKHDQLTGDGFDLNKLCDAWDHCTWVCKNYRE